MAASYVPTFFYRTGHSFAFLYDLLVYGNQLTELNCMHREYGTQSVCHSSEAKIDKWTYILKSSLYSFSSNVLFFPTPMASLSSFSPALKWDTPLKKNLNKKATTALLSITYWFSEGMSMVYAIIQLYDLIYYTVVSKDGMPLSLLIHSHQS